MAPWLNEGLAQDREGALTPLMRGEPCGKAVLVAEGDEVERPCDLAVRAAHWRERVVVGRSPVHAAHQAVGLEKRLGQAEPKLAALTPARGRGTRQRTDDVTLVEAMALVRKEPRVEGWLTVAWERQVEQPTHDGGRGRGSAKRAQQGRAPIRSHLTRMAREEDTIAALTARCGWKACVTNAPQQRRSVAEAVLCSRNAYRIERMCNRLTSRVPIAPLCGTRDDHIQGLTSLLTLGVRV